MDFFFFSFFLYELKYFWKLIINGGAWEIIIIDSQLIWNTPLSIKGCFVLNLSEISKVVCKKHDDGENNITYTYHIERVQGEKIYLDDSCGVNLHKLAPLIGKVEKV